MLRPREVVQRLKEYHPPLAGRVGLRLDFNENTIGCSPRVLERLKHLTAEVLARYPERQPAEEVAARQLGVAREQILLTNGVDEAIHLLCETYLEPDDQAIVISPTFSMYEIYVAATGAQVIRVQSEGDFSFPFSGVVRSITKRTRLIAVASPNNPTGTVARREQLLQIADAAPDAALLVDEAYFDFHGETVVDCISSTPNLFIARTFSKAHGLAGLRLGLLAGHETQMAALRRISSPYNVNALALMALSAALEDRDFIRCYVSHVKQGRERLARELQTLGIHYWPSHANFLLVRIGERHREFVDHMRQRGILVRNRSSDAGCEGCVRITLGTTEQTDQLMAVLNEVCAELDLSRRGMA